MTKTVFTAAGVALLVAVGVALLFPVKIETIVERVIEKVGSVVGPDRFPPDGCETVNGVKTCSYQSSAVSSSTF